MILILAGILLALFVGNVVMGSTSNAAVLGNVGEMVLLLTASIVFVIGILKKEADAKAAAQQPPSRVDDVQGGH